jgi:hypothetical protein
LAGPDEDACDVESGEVDGCGLVVSGGEAAPVFDASFDGVALLVGLAVEGGWSAAPAAAPPAVGGLVG